MKKKTKAAPPDYPFEVRPLSQEDGGGYLISYPDFKECIADGDTIEEAIREGRKALTAVIATMEEKGLPVPAPGTFAEYSGKFVQRLPKSLHARLDARARLEGVSINTLATTYIAEGLAGRRISIENDIPLLADRKIPYRQRTGVREKKSLLPKPKDAQKLKSA